VDRKATRYEIDKEKKTLDAVKIQREIREKISSETGSMTYEEFMKYIEQRLKITGTRPIGKK